MWVLPIQITYNSFFNNRLVGGLPVTTIAHFEHDNMHSATVNPLSSWKRSASTSRSSQYSLHTKIL